MLSTGALEQTAAGAYAIRGDRLEFGGERAVEDADVIDRVGCSFRRRQAIAPASKATAAPDGGQTTAAKETVVLVTSNPVKRGGIGTTWLCPRIC